ncbi:hypothetical protein [Mechercharimyces sp. CAU 1602]|uniref:hypothetical protein n=1 Tax=Mechercharimyces sp. CAU 1602 TaxID=2973933 RepID=UPI002162469F|nr:hypothetical protein [Mechercharimyces sp. CAU 1602]MCS1352028.1 hypothetical protein [Mechercharimyces sp. CAU 1602]
MKRGNGNSSAIYVGLTLCSITLNLVTVILSLSFLTEALFGSDLERMIYISHHQSQIVIAWSAWIVATLAMVLVLIMLTHKLGRQFRAILQLALLIWVIGASAGVLTHLIQMTIIPGVAALFLQMPSVALAHYFSSWDQLMQEMMTLFSNTAYAISALIFTTVMLRSRFLSEKASYTAVCLWALLLFAVVTSQWVEFLMPFVLGSSFILFIPWVLLVSGGDDSQGRESIYS